MKVLLLYVTTLAMLLLSPVALGALQWTLESDIDICTLFPNGAEIRKPGTCGQIITCQNGVSTNPTNKCAAKSYILSTKKCGTADKTDTYCKTPCKAKSPEWMADVKNCNDWVKCKGKTQLAAGSCPSGQVFNTKENRCYYPLTDVACERAFDVCSVAPKDQRFWDSTNCKQYFVCDKTQKQKAVVCPAGTYYEKTSGQCILKTLVKCVEHPLPDNVCGTAKLAIRNRFVSDGATCSGYFYCADLGSGKPDKNPTRGKCPDMKFFEPTRQVCMTRTATKCVEDRCDGRKSGFELSETHGCQHYLECKNGLTVAELKCDDGKYFNAEIEQCVDTKIAYQVCA